MSEATTLSDVLKSAPTASSLSGLSMLCADSSGKLQKTSKASLPMMLTTVYGKPDLNDYTQTGIFMFTDMCTHRPVAVNTAGSILFVNSHSAGYVTQTLIATLWPGDGRGIYYRVKAGPDAAWIKWRKLNDTEVGTVEQSS